MRKKREEHGMWQTRCYHSWASMRARCNNPKNPSYPNYGGRGITVCDEWSSFLRFFEDMGHPGDGESIDRIDNDKGYSKENCRWATPMQQSRNRRNLIQVTIDGETHPLSVWVERIGAVNYRTTLRRIINGWDHVEAITTPKVVKRKCIARGKKIAHADEPEIDGVPLSVAIEQSHVSHATVMQRIGRGWSLHDALSQPVRRGPHRRGDSKGVVWTDPAMEQAA